MDKKDLLIIFFLLAFGLFTRFYRLDYAEGKPIFDELKYYRGAALSYLQNQDDPNFEHPPLSKELIATGIRIFGDNPYGWRLPSLIFSLIGNIIIYFFLRDIFNRRLIGLLASLFLSFDFLYFIHARLAVPETIFATLAWLSLYFLWRHIRQSKIFTRDLFLGAIFLGLTLATKWTGLFILIPYFFLMIKQRKIKTLLLSLVTLLPVTLLLYLTTYLPYLIRHGFFEFINLQQRIFWYWLYFSQKLGLDLEPTLYFLNHAYAWILNPSWAYDALKIGGSQIRLVWSLYNPLLWFFSIFLFLKYLFFKNAKNFSKGGGLLALFIFSFYLPWLFVSRVEYPYYFLLGLPFLYGFAALNVADWFFKNRARFLAFTLTLLVLSLLFYPLVSGLPVSTNYLSQVFRIKMNWED